MDQKIDNRFKGCNVEHYVGGNQTINNYTMFKDSEREFVVTHDTNIKPVSYFTGRETELQELCQMIEAGRKSVLVSGMGGIGKTHICRKLFEKYSNHHDEDGNELYRHIGYIEYDGDMDSSLQRCLKYKEQDSPEKNQEAVWQELEHLAATGKILLFVDNVNIPMSEDLGLQRLDTILGTIVVASRRTVFGGSFEPYRLGFLSTEKCIEIYEKIQLEGKGKKVTERELPDLKYIIETLVARHTITVEFLAHIAEINEWDVKRLREELECKGFQLKYKVKKHRLVNIQESYEKLYDLSELTEAEQNILEAFSVFPYIPLATKICNQWLLADAGVSEDDDILRGLYHKGWLRFDIEQDGYALHPVFAQFIYGKCKPESGKHLGLLKACRESLQIPERGSALECQKYMPFAESMIERLGFEKNMEQTRLISATAYLLCCTAEHKKAEVLLEKCLQISKRIQGEEHPSTAMSYNNLGWVYAVQREHKKAEELCKKSLQILEKVQGKEYPETAVVYSNLAAVYVSQDKDREAEELYKKSLQIRERVLGEEHPDTAMVYSYLGFVYALQGKYKEAEELCKKSLQINERILGEEHLNTEGAYRALGRVYALQGKYREAEELYKKSLQISERIWGEENATTSSDYNNLAAVYANQEKYREAEELYKKSIQLCERILGEEHPDTAISYNNLAKLYFIQSKHELAFMYYFKAFKIFMDKFGFEDPYTKTCCQNIVIAIEESKSEGNYREWLGEWMKIMITGIKDD